MPVIRDTRGVALNPIGGRNLRGIDLSRATLFGVDLTDCVRLASDPPITGWRLIVHEGADEGWLVRTCEDCGDDCDYHADCSVCTNCCGHRVCGDCDSHVRNICQHCDYCSDCCNCSICSDCDRLVSCDECLRCSRCCDGECDGDDGEDQRYLRTEGEAWPAVEYSRPDTHGRSKILRFHNRKFSSRRLAGIEWEYNKSSDLRAWSDKWRGGVHSDGSCGYEAVTPPIAGDHIRNCLTDLGAALEAAGTTARDNCGVHVHVDASDMRWRDIYRLLAVYEKVEPILYIIGGQQRTGNTYCQPCGPMYRQALESIDPKGAILGVAFGDVSVGGSVSRGRQTQQGRPGKKHAGRYKGLNLCPWLAGRSLFRQKGKKQPPAKKDTTLEFRMHANTLDTERLINWTELLVRLVDWVIKATDKEAEDLPKSALRALCAIAPDKAVWILKRMRDWRKVTSTASGSRTVRPHAAPRRITLRNQQYVLRAA